MCSTEQSISSRLRTLISKLTSSKSQSTQLTPEQEALVTTHFSPRICSIFSSSHLLHFLPLGTQEGIHDDLVIRHLNKKSVYEQFGRIYDSGKLRRCLVDQIGMKKYFVDGYIKWKSEAESGVSGFDGCGWNDEWVMELGGVRGAVCDILNNV
ncbi:hypothetical protein ABW20_dc0105677 [Dactylellina cionopaga]|nr:hypothetical protein ABW20_dc0105677 [Dactylellina cionopaga]